MATAAHANCSSVVGRAAICALLAFAVMSSARAATDEVDANGAPVPSISTSLPGNPDKGLRKWLAERGLTYSFVLTSEVLGNVAGGMRTGGVFQGKFETIIKA